MIILPPEYTISAEFFIIFKRGNLTERVTDKRLNTLAAYRYLSDGTKIGVTDQYGNGYEYLGSLIYPRIPNGLEIESTDFAGGRILKTSAKYDLRYFVRDYLGSVRAIVDGKGQRLEAIDYMPYGSRWKDPMRLVTDNRFLYNGKEWQPTGELNVLDYGARHYDPELGRWFNPDPAMQFLNPYTFCANDPVNLVDLNGMWTETDDSFFTNDPGEIADFLNGNGDFGYLLDPTQNPQFTTETDNKQTNPNGDGGSSPSGKTVMVNGMIYSGHNSYSDVSYFLTLLRYYQTQKGKPVYITEKMLAYLLAKGKITGPKKMGDYWKANIDFYGSDWDLALSFGKATIYYNMVDGQVNVFHFQDTYNFDWKARGDRSRLTEVLTRFGSFIPGDSFDIIFIPNPYE